MSPQKKRRKTIAGKKVARAKDLQVVYYKENNVEDFLNTIKAPGAVVYGLNSFQTDGAFLSYIQKADLSKVVIEIIADRKALPISATVIRKSDSCVFYLKDITRIIPEESLKSIDEDWTVAANKFVDQLKKLPGGSEFNFNSASTASGVAAKLLQEAVTFKTVLSMSAPKYLKETFRQSYHGGISISPDEDILLEDIYTADFKACYPTILEESARQHILPVGVPKVVRQQEPEEFSLSHQLNTQLLLVSGYIPENSFALLHKTTPVGNFRVPGKVVGWFWNFEVAEQIKQGFENVQVYERLMFTSSSSFKTEEDKFANFFEELRFLRERAQNKSEGLGAKLVANSLIGRFAIHEGGAGRKIIRANSIPAHTYPVPELGPDFFQCRPEIFKNPYVLTHIASFVTAKARVQLIQSVKNSASIIYADTDSLYLKNIDDLSETGKQYVADKKLVVEKIKEAYFLGGKRYFYRKSLNEDFTQVTAGIGPIDVSGLSLDEVYKKFSDDYLYLGISKKQKLNECSAKTISRTLGPFIKDVSASINAPSYGIEYFKVKKLGEEIPSQELNELDEEKEMLNKLDQIFGAAK